MPVKTRSRKNRTVQCHMVLCNHHVLRVLIPNLVPQSPLHSQPPSPLVSSLQDGSKQQSKQSQRKGQSKICSYYMKGLIAHLMA